MNDALRSKKVPEAAVLELTYRCNSKCLFCSCPWEADRSFIQKELATDEWKKVIDHVVSLGSKHVTLTGGEPLMRPDLHEILGYIGRDKRIENKRIITNSLLLTEELLALFKEYDFALSTSLPGIKTYRKHTGSKEVDRVLYWIKRAHAVGLDVTTGITVTKLNKFELYETIANALIAGSSSILLNRFLPGGRGLKHIKRLELNRKDLNDMLQTAEEVLLLSKRQGILGTEVPYCAIDNPEQYQQLRIGYLCSAAKGFFVIDPSGFVRACNHSPVRVGTLDDFFESPYWRAFRERAYLPASCVGCKMENSCDAGCREAAHICSGNIDADDPLLVGITKRLHSPRQQEECAQKAVGSNG
ncbi:MAG: radical SAM protein [Coriobacteriia bacterium]|nr:radical SAM protein [Coriobacteriia bacterium]